MGLREEYRASIARCHTTPVGLNGLPHAATRDSEAPPKGVTGLPEFSMGRFTMRVITPSLLQVENGLHIAHEIDRPGKGGRER